MTESFGDLRLPACAWDHEIDPDVAVPGIQDPFFTAARDHEIPTWTASSTRRTDTVHPVVICLSFILRTVRADEPDRNSSDGLVKPVKYLSEEAVGC